MSAIRIILSAFLLAMSGSATAQGMFGFMGGAGYTARYKGYVSPTFETYYCAKISHHFYAGGSLSFQQYSFQKETSGDPLSLFNPLSIRNKAAFVFFCGKADMGIGRRNLCHVSLAAGPGFYTTGEQLSKERVPVGSSGNPYHGSYYFGSELQDVNTDNNVKKVIARVTLGISERIPTHGYWNIMLSQEFTMPTMLSKSGENLSVNYFAFTVGIMHKYPHVRVQHREEK